MRYWEPRFSIHLTFADMPDSLLSLRASGLIPIETGPDRSRPVATSSSPRRTVPSESVTSRIFID